MLRLPGKMSPVARQAGLAVLVHALSVGAAVGLAAGLPYWHGAAVYWCGFHVWLFGFSAVVSSGVT